MKMFITLCLLLSFTAFGAEEAPEQKPKIKYREGKEMEFDPVVVKGKVERPDLSVVTGDEGETGNGLLRLRENFLDRMASDNGEEIK